MPSTYVLAIHNCPRSRPEATAHTRVASPTVGAVSSAC